MPESTIVDAKDCANRIERKYDCNMHVTLQPKVVRVGQAAGRFGEGNGKCWKE